MVKRFIEWIYTKIIIDKTERVDLVITEGQVFWCSLGENIGYEQNGKDEFFRRPVLIFKKFNNDMFWGIPMSSKLKDGIYHISVSLVGFERSVILSQLRVLDSKRLDQFIGHVSKESFSDIKRRIIELINV